MTKDIHDNLLFEGIDRKYVDEFLASLSEPLLLKKGEFLWRQDEPGYSMYLVKSGQLDVLIQPQVGEEAILVASIEAGAVIGEICVFGEKIRSASVRAAKDSELLQVDGENFLQRVQSKDISALRIGFNIAKLLAQRVLIANNFIRKLHLVVAKTAAKSELEHFRERFSQESLFN